MKCIEKITVLIGAIAFFVLPANSQNLLKENLLTDSISVNPNPFIKRTVINYSFTNNDTVTLVVYNRWGQPVVTLFTDSVMTAGTYQDSLRMDSFPDDTYVVMLKLGHRKTKLKQTIKSASASLQETGNELNYKIYPNPFADKITIEAGKRTGPLELNITNALGQEVYKLNRYEFGHEINLKSLEKGIYFLQPKNSPAIKIVKSN